jgi:CHASE3 domain sensor protein
MRGIGVGKKIFGGFIVLILVGLIVGGVGVFSLKKVTDAGELESLTSAIQVKILDARRFEKNFIIRKDEESYQSLKKDS